MKHTEHIKHAHHDAKKKNETEYELTQKKEDTYSYRGWLVSDKFWKRALAVYGYYIITALSLVLLMMLVLGSIGYLSVAGYQDDHDIMYTIESALE